LTSWLLLLPCFLPHGIESHVGHEHLEVGFRFAYIGLSVAVGQKATFSIAVVISFLFCQTEHEAGNIVMLSGSHEKDERSFRRCF
jgi:hypothetical protein